MRIPEIPITTLRSLALLLRAAFAFARARARGLTAAVLQHGKPPSDLVVTTSSGGRYTGVLLVDEGRIAGGVVRLAGASPRLPTHSHHGPYTPLLGEHERYRESDFDPEDDEPWLR